MRKPAKKPKQATLLNKADKLAREACYARGKCEASEWMQKLGRTCGGRLEWAHVKKRHHRHVRHHPRNCKCLCTNCHWFFTNNEDYWVRFIDETDPGLWDFLNDLIRESSGKVDYQKWIDFYKDPNDPNCEVEE